MTKLHISDDLLLPKDVVTSTLIVYGGKGMGKTNFGSVLVEELTAAGLRWAVLDPLGVWWGLRHSEDGKSAGIECLILGGSHADLPIEPTGGSVVADLVVENETTNVIIDFSRKPSGEMWGIGEKIRFITEYTYRLFQRQGELVNGGRREPVFQILDEAARYIPQVIPAGNADLAKCVSAWERLIEEGRNVGIGACLLTQRSARMNKSVSEVADAIFSFRIVGPNSLKAIMDWLGDHVPKERINSMIETVRSLDRGRCLVVSPGWLKFEGVIGIRARHTFDSSATPKPGERARKVSGTGAKPDLHKYEERMKATIERVKENDPRELKTQIAQLKKELAKRPTETKSHTTETVADPRAIERAVKTATTPLLRRLEQMRKAAKDTLDGIARVSSPLVLAIANPVEEVAVPRVPAPAPVRIQTPTVRAVSAPANGDAIVSRAELRIVNRLAELVACTGNDHVRKEQLAAWSELAPTSGGFRNYLGSLRTAGLIEYPQPGMVALTDAGRSAAQPGETPTTSAEMLERAKRVLGGTEARMLDTLHHEKAAMDKEFLANQTGLEPTSGGFRNYLGRMRTLGFVEYPQPGQVKAADWLYL